MKNLIKTRYLVISTGVFLSFFLAGVFLAHGQTTEAASNSHAPRITTFRISDPATPTMPSTVLVWNTVNVSTCSVNGPNFDSSENFSGNEALTTGDLATTSTYILTCRNNSGASVSRSLVVNVPLPNKAFCPPGPFTINLRLGSSDGRIFGQVSRLQDYMRYRSFYGGGVSGYFGNATKAGVVNLQTSLGISPANGYFGPITRATVNNLVCPPPPTLVPPHIDSIDPSSGPVGTQASLLGTRSDSLPIHLYIDNQNADSAINGGSTCTSGTPCNNWVLWFRVPSLSNGAHAINVKDSQGRISNEVDFTVTATSSQPSITVISPNGGETWRVGDSKTISWQGNQQSNYYKIEIWETAAIDQGPPDHLPRGGNAWRVIESTPNTSYNWTVGTVDCGGPCTPPAPGSYKIIIRGKSGAELTSPYTGFGSSAPFTIINNQITPLRPHIDSVAPTQGTWGTSVNIFGRNFNPLQNGTSTTLLFRQNGQLLGTVFSNQITIFPDGTQMQLVLDGRLVANMNPGLYKLSVLSDHGESNGVDFTIYHCPTPVTCSPSGNHPPEILTTTVPVGPVAVGRPFGITYTARDVDNDDLSWTTRWGDGSTNELPAPCAMSGGNWIYNASHTYNQPGTYAVVTTAKDCANATDNDALNIVVTNASSTPPPPTSINVNFISSTETVTGDTNPIGNYTLTFDVTASHGDAWINLSAGRTSSSPEGSRSSADVLYSIEDGSNNTISAGASTANLQFVSGGVLDGNSVHISDGGTARFILNAAYDPISTNSYRVQMKSVGFGRSRTVAHTLLTLMPEEDYDSHLLFIQGGNASPTVEPRTQKASVLSALQSLLQRVGTTDDASSLAASINYLFSNWLKVSSE